jgi:decaprenylphospho-beta-D-erythro-pentofuranosid-2-ulose 2-reductase
MSECVLIVGATSAIAEALARRYAAEGARLALAARNLEHCEHIAADLRIRGAAEVRCLRFDAAERDKFAPLIENAWNGFDGLDVAVIAHGSLPDQSACEQSIDATLEALDINALSAIGLLVPLANRMADVRRGHIAVIGSVAGDRGRQSNYVYGAAKGCLAVFLQGLAHRLYPLGVRVLTVKPGFVDTPMTAAFDKGPLWAQPDQVARDIQRAIRKGVIEVYTPWFWRWIMRVIRFLPRPLFLRTKL